MRFILLASLLCTEAFAQNSLREFLALTSAQATQVQQWNTALNQVVGTKRLRTYQVQSEIEAESAKANPDARALGERYVELDGLEVEIAAARAAVQLQVATVLTDKQKSLVQQISTALVQQTLLRDADCADLSDTFSFVTSNNAFGSALINVPLTSGSDLATFLLGGTTTTIGNGCSQTYPASIRDYLALTDAEVAAILGNAATYRNAYARKQARVSDLQVEIRDETAKPVPDTVALGVRYTELIQIQNESAALGKQAGIAARALLTSAQRTRLESLLATSSLTAYTYAATGCNFVVIPPGVPNYYSEAQCPSDF